MTDQKPNCSTCTNSECKYLPLKDRVGRARKWNAGVLKHVEFTPRSFTEEMGCLLHQDARAYLMKDVIEELGHNIYDIESIADDGYSARAEGMKEAITLIKNGVEKK